MVDALDVYSGNNGGQPIDVACAQREGVQLIIPKASEGTHFRDPCWEAVYRACEDLGVRTGGYHFVRPDLNRGYEEAEFFLDTVLPVGLTWSGTVFACDFESYPGVPWPLAAGDESVNWLLDFLRYLEAGSGVVPWVYTNWNFLVNVLGKDERLRRYPWWYANPAPNWPADWPPALWQYGYADVPCGVGVCDANNFGPAYAAVPGGGGDHPPPSVGMPFVGDYPVTSPYGPRDGGFHYGIDFGLPNDTPVVAVDDGVIFFAGYEEAGGNHLVVLLDRPPDPAAPKAGYMHLRDFAVNVGDRVARGEVLGHSDTTGAAVTGPHLHFWMGTNANVGAVDPSPYLWPQAPAPVRPKRKGIPMLVVFLLDSQWVDVWYGSALLDSFHNDGPLNLYGIGPKAQAYLDQGGIARVYGTPDAPVDWYTRDDPANPGVRAQLQPTLR